MMTRRDALVYGLASTLPDDSTARVLEGEFARPDLSYVLMNYPARRLIAIRWPDSEQAIPIGSLLKPFAAYAHGTPFPGQLPLAIAYSSNPYFLNLARSLQPAKLLELGLAPPLRDTPETWIGLGDEWKIQPRILLNAYCELFSRAPREILDGMRLSAKVGTAREIRCDAYAKTGTAPCHHARKAAGDGYAVALYPAPNPRLALLTSLDGAPGARAARVAGEMLRRIG
jgi:cell division protein FtsI/penicillin-binding protein 2